MKNVSNFISSLIRRPVFYFIEKNRLSKKIAIILTNYNMPEKSDAIAEYLEKNVSWPYDLYLVDNGSDLVNPSRYTTVFLKKNIQTCRGWLAGLDRADKSGISYFAYWFLITSMQFVDNNDVLSKIVEKLIVDQNAVGIHPSLTPDSTTFWQHMINRNTNSVRQTWMIDNIASLYRADWFNSIGRFDPEMVYAWGIDLETSYKARKQKKSLWIDDRVMVKKTTNIGYAMNRMNMSANMRAQLADQNMRNVLRKKYGEKYWEIMTQDSVLPEWQ